LTRRAASLPLAPGRLLSDLRPVGRRPGLRPGQGLNPGIQVENTEDESYHRPALPFQAGCDRELLDWECNGWRRHLARLIRLAAGQPRG
jgi:hypothetical protein